MYERLYNANNEIVHCSKAIKGGDYKKYIEETEFNYTYKEGEEKKYFTLKIQSSNIFYKIDIGGGESREHYNEKMKIVDEKKYYDTIFKQWIEFDNCVVEQWFPEDDIRKRPDISCYDKSNKLIFCIEICYSNAKSTQDIVKLKNLKVPIIEIYIKYDNRCKHIVLPEILESNRGKYFNIKEQIKFFEDNNSRESTEINILKKSTGGESRNYKEFENSETQTYQKNMYSKVSNIDNWLQKRLNFKKSGIDFYAEIQRIENEISQSKQAHDVLDYRIGKQEQGIAKLKISIATGKHNFSEIAKRCNIQWFRNKWMTTNPQNLINEIKYWLC